MELKRHFFCSYCFLASGVLEGFFNFFPRIASSKQGISWGKRMESANNDVRKWPILPFDVSRDFIISKEILVACIEILFIG